MHVAIEIAGKKLNLLVFDQWVVSSPHSWRNAGLISTHVSTVYSYSMEKQQLH